MTSYLQKYKKYKSKYLKIKKQIGGDQFDDLFEQHRRGEIDFDFLIKEIIKYFKIYQDEYESDDDDEKYKIKLVNFLEYLKTIVITDDNRDSLINFLRLCNNGIITYIFMIDIDIKEKINIILSFFNLITHDSPSYHTKFYTFFSHEILKNIKLKEISHYNDECIFLDTIFLPSSYPGIFDFNLLLQIINEHNIFEINKFIYVLERTNINYNDTVIKKILVSAITYVLILIHEKRKISHTTIDFIKFLFNNDVNIINYQYKNSTLYILSDVLDVLHTTINLFTYTHYRHEQDHIKILYDIAILILNNNIDSLENFYKIKSAIIKNLDNLPEYPDLLEKLSDIEIKKTQEDKELKSLRLVWLSGITTVEPWRIEYLNIVSELFKILSYVSRTHEDILLLTITKINKLNELYSHPSYLEDKEKITENTLLHSAILHNYIPIVFLLLLNKSPFNIKNKDKVTAIELASDKPEIIKLIDQSKDSHSNNLELFNPHLMSLIKQYTELSCDGIQHVNITEYHSL